MRRYQQVNVVCHQTVRVHRALLLGGEFPQVSQVQQVVAVASEAGRPIVAALDDVRGNAWNDEPGLPGHSVKTWAWWSRLTGNSDFVPLGGNRALTPI
jgi:hypothetical protein